MTYYTGTNNDIFGKNFLEANRHFITKWKSYDVLEGLPILVQAKVAVSMEAQLNFMDTYKGYFEKSDVDVMVVILSKVLGTLYTREDVWPVWFEDNEEAQKIQRVLLGKDGSVNVIPEEYIPVSMHTTVPVIASKESYLHTIHWEAEFCTSIARNLNDTILTTLDACKDKTIGIDILIANSLTNAEHIDTRYTIYDSLNKQSDTYSL